MEKIPRAGDVVIHRQVHSPAVYVLSRRGGPLQFSHTTYQAAEHQATGFARKKRLDVWYTTDEIAFKRVAHHRPTS
jgi:hypothetical protein